MRLGPMEQMVQDQIIEEYPDFDTDGMVYINSDNGRDYKDLDALTYYLTNQMWETFDEKLMYIIKKEKTNGKD